MNKNKSPEPIPPKFTTRKDSFSNITAIFLMFEVIIGIGLIILMIFSI